MSASVLQQQLETSSAASAAATQSNLALAQTLAEVQQELSAVVRDRDSIAALAETNMMYLDAVKRGRDQQEQERARENEEAKKAHDVLNEKYLEQVDLAAQLEVFEAPGPDSPSLPPFFFGLLPPGCLE